VILPEILYKISKELTLHNATAIIVGGAIRDHFLKKRIKDYDIEVYGLESIEELEDILKPFGAVNVVGRSFGVLKFVYDREEYDFSFPRVENKVSKGHRGFEVICDGNLDFKEASRRRDFTINSMGYNIQSGVLLDPFNGIKDIQDKILRAVDGKSFIEDPLRVYRAIQFSARFNYTLSNDTEILCKNMVKDALLDELAEERVYQEWVKLFLKSDKPSIGFNLMKRLGVLRYFPELEELNSTLWSFTMSYIDRAVEYKTDNSRTNLTLLFATLSINIEKKKRKSLLYRLTNNHKLIASIVNLVEYYHIPNQLYKSRADDSEIRILSTKVNISLLTKLVESDIENIKSAQWLYRNAKRLNVEERAPKPIIKGRDLIRVGLEPSPQFKDILNELYMLQLRGEII